MSEVKERVEIFCLQKILPDLDGTANLLRIMEGGAFGAFPNAPL